LSRPRQRILIVDDERDIVQVLEFALRQAGFDTAAAADSTQAMARIREAQPDLVILDLMLPDLPGTEVCRQLKSAARTKGLPVIMLTARGEEVDRVVGFELGADDYITKPFSMREFRSRVKAVLRRSDMSRLEQPSADEEPLEVGGLRIDFAKRTVRLKGELVPTTFVEFEILSALATSPGRVFTRDMLLARIWGDSAYRDPRTIDVHIRHLREKLEPEPEKPRYILTVRGAGYSLRGP